MVKTWADEEWRRRGARGYLNNLVGGEKTKTLKEDNGETETNKVAWVS